MKEALLFLFGLCLLLQENFAHAVSLDVIPPSKNVVVGNPLDVSIVISGLIDNAAPSLGTFDITVLFNPLILDFGSAAFGNQLDLSGQGSITSVTPGAGSVNLFELSLDLPDDLDT